MKTFPKLISALALLAILVTQLPVSFAKTEGDEAALCAGGKKSYTVLVNGKNVEKACDVGYSERKQKYPEEPWTIHEHAFFNNSIEDENFLKMLKIRKYRVYLDDDVKENTNIDEVVCTAPPEGSKACKGEELTSDYGGARVTLTTSDKPEYPYMATWEYGVALVGNKDKSNEDKAKYAQALPMLFGGNPTLDSYFCEKSKQSPTNQIFKDLCTKPSAEYKNRGFNTFIDDGIMTDADSKLIQMFSLDIKKPLWTATTHSYVERAHFYYPQKTEKNAANWAPEGGKLGAIGWSVETSKKSAPWEWEKIGTDKTIWERTDLPVANFCKQLNVTATAAEVNKPINFTVAPVAQGQGNIADLRFSWTATLGGGSALVGTFDGGLNPYNTEKKTANYSGGPSDTKIKVATTDVFGNIYPGCVWETTLKAKDVPPPTDDDICAYISVTPSGVLDVNTINKVTINIAAAKTIKGKDVVGDFAYTDLSNKGTFTDLITNTKSPFKLVTKNKQVFFEGAVDGTTLLIEALGAGNNASCKATIQFKKPNDIPPPPTDCTKTPYAPECIKNQISDNNIEKRVEGQKIINISPSTPLKKIPLKYQILYTPVIPTSTSYTEITDDLWVQKVIYDTYKKGGKIILKDDLISVLQIDEVAGIKGTKQVAVCNGNNPNTWKAPCFTNKIKATGTVMLYGVQKKILITYNGIADSKISNEECKKVSAVNGCGEEFINVARYTSYQTLAKVAPVITGKSQAKVIAICPYILARAGGDVLFHSPLDTKLIDISQCSNVKTTDDVVIKPKIKKPVFSKEGKGTAGFDATHKICDRSNISGQNVKDQPIDYQNPLENISSLLCEFQVELQEELQQKSIETSIKESRLRVARWNTTTQKVYNGSIPQGQNVFRVKGNISIGNITSNSFGGPANIRPVTFIAEDGDIYITGNIDTTQNQKSGVFTSKQGTIALIALNGNIIIQKHVDTVSAVLFAQKDAGSLGATSKGRIMGGGGTSDNILTIIGSVYGDIEDIVKARQPLGKILSLGKDQSAFTVRYDERIFFNTPPVLQDLVNISQTEVAR